MKLSNFAWFIDLFRPHLIRDTLWDTIIFNIWWVLLDNSDYQSNTSTYCTDCLYFHIWWVWLDNSDYQPHTIHNILLLYAKFSINMVNPYGGQYIVLSSIEFNHHFKALLLANIVYFYIRDCLCNIGNIYQLKLLGTAIYIFIFPYKMWNVTDYNECESNWKDLPLISTFRTLLQPLLTFWGWSYNLPGSHHVFSVYLSSVKICNYMNK